MKIFLIALLVVFSYKPLFAQLNVPNNSVQAKAVINPALVIQVGARKLELISNLRALPLGNSKYQLINSESSYSSSIYGVAYDHTQKAYVFLTGDISFKLLNNAGLSSLSSTVSLRSKLLAGPSTYVLNVTSPSDVVKIFSELKSDPAVEWVEIFTIQGVISP